MYTQLKSSNGITLVPLETRLLTERKVFIEGEITTESAIHFVKQIIFLNSENKAEPIKVFINSPGGEVTAGLMMYDAVVSSEAPIIMNCIGSAYSMAAVLFASGTNGRLMLPHSELMLHEPLLGNRVSGSASSIRSISDSLLETRKKINEILAKHTGKDIKDIEKETVFDHYFSAQESIDFGLADKIMGLNGMMEV